MTPVHFRTPLSRRSLPWSGAFVASALAVAGLAPVAGAVAAPQAVSASVVSATTTDVTLAPGTETQQTAGTTSLTDVLVHTQFTVPDAYPIYYSAQARRQADGRAYRARVVIPATGRQLLQILRVEPGGAVTTLKESLLTAPALVGTSVDVDLSISGSNPVTLQARTRVGSAPVTDAWQLTATDTTAQQISGAGTSGMHAYLSRGAAKSVVLRTTALSATDTTRTTPTPPPPTPAPVGSSGSAPVGTTTYAAPAGAVYVSTSGSDAGSGSLSAPKRTVTAAIAVAPSGGTIVVRGGTYYESVTVPSNKSLTIQSFPSEAVWFDATVPVSGLAKTGNVWATSWRVHLDHSPTDTRGAPDYTTPGWQFVNPAYPMAPYPEQVWVGGVEQRQVKSLSLVGSGSFYLDEGAERLYLGTDPTGKSVRSSVLGRAFSVQSANTTIRGIGVRNYATSVPDQGAVRTSGANFVLENVVVADSSTGGVGVFAPGARLRHITVSGSGQQGIQGHFADDIAITDSRITNSNDERFNQIPAAGGIKLTSSRKVLLSGSVITGGVGSAFWSDMACYDLTVVGNTIANNSWRGIFLELSSKAVVANNVLRDNGGEQLTSRQTDRVKVWNNTFVGSSKAVEFVRDSRNQSNTAYARDTRRPFPDPEMPWSIGNSQVSNNIQQSSASYLLSVEDYTHEKGASQLGIVANGNVYSQQRAGVPGWLVVWARPGTDPAVYGTLAGFMTATGQERQSLSLIVPTAVGSDNVPLQSVLDKVGSVAQSLPSDVASVTGRATGAKYLGAWR
ncbi:right-handed parallel beta-helix repeat-containing protein [Terrabacter sp. Ter38]|uniref:right-handed parallel beta-helix repeat-containing protein n=1 Tax=Terrabacter sp. Ter38 TaxID=2926030 RepID=UPI00211780A4|nr:right-handed parallel beta-helix repeat-containing protein [Terrabacter sp. Ter38]